MVDEKWCNDCKTSLPILDFYKDKSVGDGFDYFCKLCRKKRKLSRKTHENYYHKAYRDSHQKKREQYSRQFNEENKDYFTDWRQLNKGKMRAYSKKYRSIKSKATPYWLTEAQYEAIESFYLHARDCEVVSGEKYHVDHIVPLQGKNVCGLHVPWNLQVLPADLNISKSNKW